ncbi:MAG: hypothetical protein RL518_2309, partial [Pseudomonadota bacterium]
MTVSNQKTELVHRAARRRRRRPQRVRALITLCGVLAVGYLSYTPAQHLLTSFITGADRSFVTYRLISERDALRADNQRLQGELEALRAKAAIPTGTAFEASVRAQLEELQGIIAAATELDLGEDGPTIVRKGKKSKKREEVASTLKPIPGRTSQKGARPAMGGGEVECTEHDECSTFVRKQNISLKVAPSFYEVEELSHDLPYAPTESDLLRRLKTLSLGLRALPLGYPAEGDVTSHYGHRLSPFSRRPSFHEGMDLSLDT